MATYTGLQFFRGHGVVDCVETVVTALVVISRRV